MLGLRYDTVQIVPYRPEWKRAFSEERERLIDALFEIPCEIEHVGSTAVPGLSAKPILDIAIAVAPGGETSRALLALQTIGYEYRVDAGAEGGHVLVRGPAPLVRTHHIHVVAPDDPQWESYLLFRDLLRQDKSARASYSAEKTVLGRRHRQDRDGYTAAKTEIVQRLLAKARRGSTARD